MKPSRRNLLLAWSIRYTRQTHSLSKNEMGWMQATTSISLGEEGEEFFLDIHSDRAHRADLCFLQVAGNGLSGQSPVMCPRWRALRTGGSPTGVITKTAALSGTDPRIQIDGY